jgi:O-methyltransferase
VPADLDALAAENARLSSEARDLRERIAAVESSRWWRLNPRRLLRRRRPDVQTDGKTTSAHGPLPLDFEQSDVELYERVAGHTMTPPARIYALTRAVEYVVRRRVPGAIVECGVWRGGSMMAAALTLLRLGATDRDLYLFDTFAGMTAPGSEDVTLAGDAAADLLVGADPDSDLRAEAGIENVRAGMLSIGYPAEKIHLVEGAVEETLPDAAPTQIALLRLDTDWYASTKHELHHLYPRLGTGGILIVDDYGYWRGARTAVDEYLQEENVYLLLNRIDNSARIAIKI